MPRRALLVLAALALAAPAAAHDQSRGASFFAVDESGEVAIRIEMNALDLVDWLGAPMPAPDDVEGQARLDKALSVLLPRSLRLSADGEGCAVSWERLERMPRDDVALVLRARCPRMPERLRIDWGLFRGAVLDHVSIARVTAPGGIAHATSLSRRAPRFEAQVSRPSSITAAGRVLATTWRRAVEEPSLILAAALIGVLAARARRAALAALLLASAAILGAVLARAGAPRPTSQVLVLVAFGAAAAAAGLALAARLHARIHRARAAIAAVLAALLGVLTGLGREPVVDAILSASAGVALPLLAFGAVFFVLAAPAALLGSVAGKRTERRIDRGA